MKRISSSLLLIAALAFCSCSNTSSEPTAASNASKENVQPDTCNDPDASIACCFVNMPRNLTSKMQIAPADLKWKRMIIKGKLLDAKTRQAYPDAVMYAYHTDDSGLYEKKGDEKGMQKWHGYLHGWCRTDNEGNYEIHTIRPAPYPDNTIPAHIHIAMKLADGTMFYVNDIVFADDKLANAQYLSRLDNSNNPKDIDNGIVELKEENNVWIGERNICIKK